MKNLTKKTDMKNIVAAMVIIALVALLAAGARARGMTPLNGKPRLPSEASCFRNDWSRLTNANCSSYRGWLVDAVIDTSNNYHAFDIAGRGTGSTVVRCWAFGITADGLSGWSVYADRALSSWGWLNKAAPNVWVPGVGQLYFDCELPQTGGVSAFHYSI